MTSARLAIEVSAPTNPAWQADALDRVIDDVLSRLNHGLADLGIRAERSTAAVTGEDVVIIGRIALVDDNGRPAVGAFERDPVGHGSPSREEVNHPVATTPIPSETGGRA